MGSFFSGLWSWFSGSSISSNLAKTALLGYVSRLLNDSIASDTNNNTAQQSIDYGARIQLNPSTDNKIPVLYGEAYFGGMISDAYLSSDYKKMTYVLTLSEVTGTTISGTPSSYTFHDVYLGSNRVIFKADGCTVNYTVDSSSNQDISMQDLVTVRLFKGVNPIAPQGFSVSLPYSYQVVPGWTAGTHPMTNLIFAVVEVNYNRSKNVTSIPDCQFHITNSMGLPGDVLNDYMQNTRYGASIPSTDIDSTLIALNTYATTGFSYKDVNSVVQSGTIRINGLIKTEEAVLSNMERITTAASSWLSYDIHTGKWTVIINKIGTSIASFSDSNIVGEISISGTSLTQLNNVAYVKYQNTDILDTTDFVRISIPDNELFANEPRSSTQLDLPLTNKQAVAMKIGLQQLKQERIDKIIQFKSDYSYINIKAGDIIDVTSDVYGYTNKLFRVITTEETENDTGSIEISFTCLEYNSSVYDYDIQEYLVETDDGILQQGSIGKPNAPTVTKMQVSNVPRIVIAAVVPSGIVDAIEYWITFDTTVMNDSARTYIKIGEYSNTNGLTLTENTTVSYTYSQLGQSDFYVKVRGVNNLTTGPYSDPSGLIQYKPTVVANGINSDSQVIDGMGIALTALGLMELIMKLDELFGGDNISSLTDKVFDWFKNETGVDLVGDAKNGTLAVATNLEIKNHGTSISPTTSSINFAAPLNASGSGDVTVSLDASSVTVCSTPTVGQILAWNGTCWEPIDSCCDVTFQPPPPDPVNCPPPPPPVPDPPVKPSVSGGYTVSGSTNAKVITYENKIQCNGTVESKRIETPINGSVSEYVNANPDAVVEKEPASGDLDLDSTISFDFGTDILKGTGIIYILNYLTGAIEKTIDIADVAISGSELIVGDLTGLPEGGQYVVQVPQGAVTTIPNSTYPIAISNDGFTTDPFSTSPKIELLKFEIDSSPILQDKQNVNTNTNIKLYFNRELNYNTGNIILHHSGGSITFNSNNFTNGNPFIINPTNDLLLNTEYYLTIPSSALKSKNTFFEGVSDVNKIKFKTTDGPKFTVDNIDDTHLIMDRKVMPSNGGTIRIYDMSNNLIKEFTTVDRLVQFKG